MQITSALLPFIVIRLNVGAMNITAACPQNNGINLVSWCAKVQPPKLRAQPDGF
tara:strand:+ start:466 stop:627 length:162 start_codon:yes stop_codon:yes gene_type:complete